MRLYLSSYRLGVASDQLMALIGKSNKVAVVENALDLYSTQQRLAHRRRTYDPYREFVALGAKPTELDLRLYRGQPDKLHIELENFGLIWVLGGNAFVLRRAMRQAGFDSVIHRLLAQDSLVYGGFSAGAVVAGPTLKGIDIIDDPNAVPNDTDPAIIWDGLGLVPYSIVPHFRSLHPEADLAERAAQYMTDNQLNFMTIQDDDVIIYENNESRYVSAKDRA